MRWDGTYAGACEVCAWANVPPAPGDPPEEPWVDYTYHQTGDGEIVVDGMQCHTVEGPLNVTVGDWVICGIAREYYPCKPAIFEATYERAAERARVLPDSKAQQFVDSYLITGREYDAKYAGRPGLTIDDEHEAMAYLAAAAAASGARVLGPAADLLKAAIQFDAVIQIIESGMSAIPFGQEGATFDGARDRLRAAVGAYDAASPVPGPAEEAASG